MGLKYQKGGNHERHEIHEKRGSAACEARRSSREGAVSTLYDLVSAERNCGKAPEWRNFSESSSSTGTTASCRVGRDGREAHRIASAGAVDLAALDPTLPVVAGTTASCRVGRDAGEAHRNASACAGTTASCRVGRDAGEAHRNASACAVGLAAPRPHPTRCDEADRASLESATYSRSYDKSCVGSVSSRINGGSAILRD